MKALIVIYALGVIAWVGMVHGNAPTYARQYRVSVILRSLVWPVLLTFVVGKMLGKWARQ